MKVKLALLLVSLSSACSSPSSPVPVTSSFPDAGQAEAAQVPDAQNSEQTGSSLLDAGEGEVGQEVGTLRSYVLTAKLSVAPNMPTPPSGYPTEHQFTVTLDLAAGTLRTGAAGRASKVALVGGSSGWQTQAAIELSMSSAAGTSYQSISYDEIFLQTTTDGCSGTASGSVAVAITDEIYKGSFTAVLTGTLDRQSPQIISSPRDPVAIHPLDSVRLDSFELLPAATQVRLQAAQGAAVPLAGLPTDGADGVSGFILGPQALAFGETYQTIAQSGLADLAGNQAAPESLPTFTTLADPGLFAQDGFEGTVAAYLSGSVGPVDSSKAPVPTGSRALLIPGPGWSGNPGCQGRFSARMAVSPGATTVKARFRTIRMLGVMASPFFGTLQIGVPNGNLATYTATPSANAVASSQPDPAGPLPGSSTYGYGPLMEWSFPLPAGSKDEIIFDLFPRCGQPFSPSDGLLLDDLRVE
jgi:hypothetical protein